MLNDIQCLYGMVATLSRSWSCLVAAGACMVKRVSLVDKKEEDTKRKKRKRKKQDKKAKSGVKNGKMKK